MNGISWLVVAALTLAAMFVAVCNYALRTLNRIRLEEALARRGHGGRAQNVVDHLGQLILTTAVVRIILNIATILVLAYAPWRWVQSSPWLRALLVGAAAFVLIIVFTVTIPSAWAKYAGAPTLARSLGLLNLLRRVLLPLVRVLAGVDEVVRRLSGAPRTDDYEQHIEQQILSAVTEGEREGVVDADEKEMIESVLQLQDTRVEQTMTPRTEMVGLDVHSDLETVLRTLAEAGHSRIPVYEDSLDNIVGVLYAKDLLLRLGGAQVQAAQSPGAAADPLDLRSVMREPVFIPETKPLGELLDELRRRKVHVAIVLDEFGGTAGLVTIEDILEEIVGDIADEHEQDEPVSIRRIDAETFELDGRVHVDDLNDELGLHLPENEEYDTISGLMISELGHIPAKGETLTAHGVTLTVLDAEPRKINRLRLKLTPTAQPPTADNL
ncbi:MAG: hypothetical protein BIFFINMI_03106 [Phycisphaerae bacterium]|nr:hypothetical protein [Phycisphaerae bacterium]